MVPSLISRFENKLDLLPNVKYSITMAIRYFIIMDPDRVPRSTASHVPFKSDIYSNTLPLFNLILETEEQQARIKASVFFSIL